MAFLGIKNILAKDDTTLYMKRLFIGRLCLHIIYQPDQDDDCHDHPWDFTTFPLTSYVEHVIHPTVVQMVDDAQNVFLEKAIIPPSNKTSSLQLVRAFRFHKRRATHTHRILGRWSGYSETPNGYYYRGAPRHLHTPHVAQGTIVTLVWKSKPYRKWGFLKNRDNLWCWQFWKDYLAGGRHGGC